MSVIGSAAEGGFFMPAEWAPHERTWMAWPSRAEVWGARLEGTKRNYVDVAHAIRRFEPVAMLVNPGDKAEAHDLLGSDIDLVTDEIDDSWARDTGPSFLVNGSGGLAGVDLRFNAWGGKYSPYRNDDALARKIIDRTVATPIVSSLTGEGGGLCVDGEGTLLTTESCFLNPNRNPGWRKTEVEDELKRTFGVSKVIWLPGNISETETDGHIDGIAMFVKPGVVLLETVPDKNDPAAAIVAANLRALEDETDAQGRPLAIELIEEAYDAEGFGEKFCRSYVNFYFANGAIIMPCYGIAADDQARDALQRLHPDREVVQVRIDDIAIGGGGIHCITQQQPARISLG